jgi:hypothetical protein
LVERKKKKTENIKPIFLCASSSQPEWRKRDVCMCGTREFLPLLYPNAQEHARAKENRCDVMKAVVLQR